LYNYNKNGLYSFFLTKLKEFSLLEILLEFQNGLLNCTQKVNLYPKQTMNVQNFDAIKGRLI